MQLGVILRIAQAETIGKRTEQRNRQNEREKEVGLVIDLEACATNDLRQGAPRIAAEMPQQAILVGCQPLIRRDGDIPPPAGLQTAMEGGKRRGIVLDMFEDIEQAAGGDRPVGKPDILERAADDMLDPPLPRRQCALRIGLQDHHLVPGALQAERDKAVATRTSTGGPCGGNCRTASAMQKLRCPYQYDPSSSCR